jgi:hypothetical protein
MLAGVCVVSRPRCAGLFCLKVSSCRCDSDKQMEGFVMFFRWFRMSFFAWVMVCRRLSRVALYRVHA